MVNLIDDAREDALCLVRNQRSIYGNELFHYFATLTTCQQASVRRIAQSARAVQSLQSGFPLQ